MVLWYRCWRHGSTPLRAFVGTCSLQVPTTTTTCCIRSTQQQQQHRSLSSSLSSPYKKRSSTSCLQVPTGDVEMIAANHRCRLSSTTTTTSSSSNTNSPLSKPVPHTTAAMQDEYGAMDDSGDTFVVSNYQLENKSILPTAQLRYQTYGTLNEQRDNVLVICHALTGNASLHSWWSGLLGPNKAFDTSKYFVICCNILGSCYGSTSPQSICPQSNRPYGLDFPDISVQDTVQLQLRLLREQLNIRSVKSVIGGSFGGMQAVEWSVQAGVVVDNNTTPYLRSVIPIACGAQHTAWQIGISEVQRQAIFKDPHWQHTNNARAGLEIARQLGMISYRTPKGYGNKFGRKVKNGIPYGKDAEWQVKSYLEYQGKKFLDRFDAITYVKLTEQMDSHDVCRGRGANHPRDVLQHVRIPTLVLGIDSDILYPLSEQEELVECFSNAQLKVIHSDDGHDGFLLEQEQVGSHIVEFLDGIE